MSRLHPLHTPELISQTVLATGTYFDNFRGTGRTTARALGAISTAIHSPFKWHYLSDHTEGDDEYLFEMVRDMIGVLGLREFYFDKTNYAICFGKK